jgi:hypothetical protein
VQKNKTWFSEKMLVNIHGRQVFFACISYEVAWIATVVAYIGYEKLHFILSYPQSTTCLAKKRLVKICYK